MATSHGLLIPDLSFPGQPRLKGHSRSYYDASMEDCIVARADALFDMVRHLTTELNYP